MEIPNKWKVSLDSPVASQMTIFKKTFTARRWWTLEPDQSVFASGLNIPSTRNFASGIQVADDLNAAARSADGDCILIYLSSPSTVSIQMDKITTGDRVRVTWINPQTGTEKPAGEYPNRGTQTFTTPEDWPDQFLDAVLILEVVTNQAN